MPARNLKLTPGPMNWISLNGRNRGEYWLLKSDHFHVDLQPLSETFTGGITAKVSDEMSSRNRALFTLMYPKNKRQGAAMDALPDALLSLFIVPVVWDSVEPGPAAVGVPRLV